jgi:hypothetical protein
MHWKGLILPMTYKKFDPSLGRRIYFIAGPIRGGGNWQSTAIHHLFRLDPDCYIVCPCRYEADHPLVELATEYNVGMKASEIQFGSQTMWERHYLQLASKHGAIIFWLGLEDKNNPRPKEDGPYGRDTYGELGRWSVRSAEEKARVFVGAHSMFNGLSVIKKNLDADHGKDFPVYSSLEETIKESVQSAKNSKIDWELNRRAVIT